MAYGFNEDKSKTEMCRVPDYKNATEETVALNSDSDWIAHTYSETITEDTWVSFHISNSGFYGAEANKRVTMVGVDGKKVFMETVYWDYRLDYFIQTQPVYVPAGSIVKIGTRGQANDRQTVKIVKIPCM